MNARCACARSWGLHSPDCALYAHGHELAANQSQPAPTALRCRRCGDEDGPFKGTAGDILCEACINRGGAW